MGSKNAKEGEGVLKPSDEVNMSYAKYGKDWRAGSFPPFDGSRSINNDE